MNQKEELLTQVNNQQIVEQLKLHLAEKYSHYSEQELDILIHKFLADYLQYQAIDNGE